MSYLLWLPVLTLLLFRVAEIIKSWRRKKSIADKIPGLITVPFIGIMDKVFGFPYFQNISDINARVFQVIAGHYALFKKEGICHAWMANKLYVILLRAEMVEKILTSSILLEKSEEYEFLAPWLGTGLLTSNGSKWKSRRKMLTPTFHFRILEGYLPIFNEHAKMLVTQLKELKKDATIEVFQLFSLCALGVICDTAMGIKLDAHASSHSTYVRAVKALGKLFLIRASRPWLWPKLLFHLSDYGKENRRHLKVAQDFIKNVIREKKLKASQIHKTCQDGVSHPEINNENEKKLSLPFLDMLLQLQRTNDDFTDDNIKEEVATFMLGGHETTAVGLAWVIYLLGLHPDIQEKVRIELEEILGEDRMRPLIMEDISKLKYLDCVIKEGHRLYPSVPLIGRKVQEDFVIDDYIIPKDATLMISPYMLHRDSNSFANPEHFNPDNFLPNNVSGRHLFSYIPFSAGPRNCIGQRFAMNEEKIILAYIIRNFYLESMQPRDKLQLSPTMVTTVASGLHIRFEERK